MQHSTQMWFHQSSDGAENPQQADRVHKQVACHSRALLQSNDNIVGSSDAALSVTIRLNASRHPVPSSRSTYHFRTRGECCPDDDDRVS